MWQKRETTEIHFNWFDSTELVVAVLLFRVRSAYHAPIMLSCSINCTKFYEGRVCQNIVSCTAYSKIEWGSILDEVFMLCLANSGCKFLIWQLYAGTKHIRTLILCGRHLKLAQLIECNTPKKSSFKFSNCWSAVGVYIHNTHSMASGVDFFTWIMYFPRNRLLVWFRIEVYDFTLEAHSIRLLLSQKFIRLLNIISKTLFCAFVPQILNLYLVQNN